MTKSGVNQRLEHEMSLALDGGYCSSKLLCFTDAHVLKILQATSKRRDERAKSEILEE